MDTTGFEIIKATEEKIEKNWMMVLLTMIGLMGVLLTISLSLDENPAIWMYSGAFAYSLLIICVALRYRKFSMIYFYGSAVVMMTILRSALQTGFLQVLNHGIALYNYNNGTEIYYYSLDSSVDTEPAYAIFMFYFMSVNGILLSHWLYEHKITYFIIYNVGIITIVILLQSALGMYAVVFAIIAIAGAIVWKGTTYQSDKKMVCFMTVCLACGIVGSVVLLQTMQYEENEVLAAVKVATVEKAEQQIYGVPEIPEGNLQHATQLTTSDDVKFSVTASEPGVYYLKGYVGGNYENGMWKDISNDSYGDEYQGLFTWLGERDFSSFTQLSEYLSLIKENDNDISLVDMEITQKQAKSKYTYVPYGISEQGMDNFAEVNKDLTVGKPSAETLRYCVCNYDMADMLVLDYEEYASRNDIDGMKTFCEAQDEYQGFVEEHYLNVDKEFYDFFAQQMAIDEVQGYVSVTTTIRKWLEDESMVSEEEQVSDYLMYFLKRTKIGNSNFYASAATLMYRSFGIPARYVEGYRVSIEDGSRNVTGNQIHAWVEIYKSGIGWIPIEVTPGYYDDLQLSGSSIKQKQMMMQQQLEEQLEEQTKKTQENKKDARKIGVIIVFLVLMNVLLIVIVIMILRRWFVNGWRVWSFRQQNQELRLGAVVKYMRRLMEWSSMKESELTEEVKEILLSYRFAEKRITITECNCICANAEILQKKIYDTSSWLQRLWLKYGVVLV